MSHKVIQEFPRETEDQEPIVRIMRVPPSQLCVQQKQNLSIYESRFLEYKETIEPRITQAQYVLTFSNYIIISLLSSNTLMLFHRQESFKLLSYFSLPSKVKCIDYFSPRKERPTHNGNEHQTISHPNTLIVSVLESKLYILRINEE